MLASLSGKKHTVCTGVCVIAPDGTVQNFHELTRVQFRPFDQEVIESYFTKVNPLDKAGSYGIQEYGDMLVEDIVGSYDNVMGLPVDRVLNALNHCGSPS